MIKNRLVLNFLWNASCCYMVMICGIFEDEVRGRDRNSHSWWRPGMRG
jgi:hypothetical protein